METTESYDDDEETGNLLLKYLEESEEKDDSAEMKVTRFIPQLAAATNSKGFFLHNS